MNAILSCRYLLGIKRNKYIFYLSEVERRIIHSDDYQEMGFKAEGSSLTHESRIQRKCYSKEDYHFFLPLDQKTFVDDYFSDLLLFNNRKTKFNNTVTGHHSVLLGSRSCHIWSKCIISTLSAYSVFWAFVDGTLTFAALPAGVDLTDCQQKWKLLDKRILGLLTNTIGNLLLSHVIYDWTDPLTFPSISKRLLGQAKDSLWNHRFYKLSFVSLNKSHSNTFALNMLRQISLTSCHSSITQP